MRTIVMGLILVLVVGGAAVWYMGPWVFDRRRAEEAAARRRPGLEASLVEKGLSMGDPLYIRIVKDERELEMWVRDDESGRYELFRAWPVLAMSGRPGPKLAEGDRLAPEGFYDVTPDRLHPHSRYHLAFNIGYPNDYDRAHGRTGSFIMVHGSNASIGCFAMGDEAIEEIYTMVAASLDAGQESVPVHIFPFRMTEEAMRKHADSQWIAFWRELKPAWDVFERTRRVPEASVEEGRYVVRR